VSKAKTMVPVITIDSNIFDFRETLSDVKELQKFLSEDNLE
jgi:hypothetical protein